MTTQTEERRETIQVINQGFCPMKFGNPNNRPQDCYCDSDCAWWDEKKNQCCIKTLSERRV